MEDFPPLPSVEPPGSNADGSDGVKGAVIEAFREGHLWTEELIDGDPLRFRVTDAGFLEFGDAEGVFEHDAVPLRYRAAVRAVRESFARDAFVSAVETPGSVTFFGIATHARRLPYDLDRIPPFVGTALHDVDRERYLPPDTVRRAFERVGLPTIDPIEKELRAAHVDPDDYPIPDSRWYDGPAAGVVFHNKGGERAVRRNPAIADDEPGPDAGEPGPDAGGPRPDAGEPPEAADAGVSAEFDLEDRVTDAWLDRLLNGSDDHAGAGVDVAAGVDIGAGVDAGVNDDVDGVETAVERALERLARETTPLATGVDGAAESDLRSALAGRIDRYRRS